MKQRDIWIRKKKEKGELARFVVEGRSKNKSKKVIFIWTISRDLTDLLDHLIKTSFFTKEKSAKIEQILDSLKYMDAGHKKQPPKVRTTNLTRTQKNDGNLDDDFDSPDDLIKELSERVE